MNRETAVVARTGHMNPDNPEEYVADTVTVRVRDTATGMVVYGRNNDETDAVSVANLRLTEANAEKARLEQQMRERQQAGGR